MKRPRGLRPLARRLIPRSLSGRLLAGSGLATLLALGLVLLLMQQVLGRFVTGQIDQRLDNKIVALASQLRAAPDGTLVLDGEADGPPFDKRHHRSFWLVRGPRNTLATGWLSEAALPAIPDAATKPPPPPPPPGPEETGAALRPRGAEAFGLGTIFHERVAAVRIGTISATILVAAPVEAIAGPVREAMSRVAPPVLLLGAALAALAFAQVRIGLRPLAALRRQVAEVGDGRRALLPAVQPREVAPLVAELNRLIERNAANLEGARRHVANLAHGLKTPLATLQLGVERLEGPGEAELRLLLAQIDRRVRHHLGRARAGVLAGPGRARTALAPCLADLGAALGRIHAGREVNLELDVAPDLVLACESHDVDEIFGNLLDNAFRFARGTVRCTARRDRGTVAVAVSDDGPGLAAADAALALQPGRRLDEATPGHGFGLTIARELVELYGGTLQLGPGPHGGLRVAITLPAAPA